MEEKSTKTHTNNFFSTWSFIFCSLCNLANHQFLNNFFYQWDGLSPKTFIGLENYIMLFDDEYFYVALWNNVKWLVCFMLAVPVGLGLAIFLNQTIFGIRVVKSLFFFPFVISQVVIGLIFYVVLSP